MPELPDIVVYIEALERRILHHRLERVRLSGPYLLRTATPPIQELEGKTSARPAANREAHRDGFRPGLLAGAALDDCRAAALAGSRPGGSGTARKKLSARSRDVAAFDFDSGCLTLSEAGSRKRASIHVVAGAEKLADFDPGGLEVLDSRLEEFAARLSCENHTLKRALTDPHLMSGIGNAYSDEILHAAQLSPAALTAG